MFRGLGEEERTRFRKKNEKTHGGQKWVGRDKTLSYDTKQCEIFFAVPKPSLNETAFNVKPSRWFSGPITKVM